MYTPQEVALIALISCIAGGFLWNWLIKHLKERPMAEYTDLDKLVKKYTRKEAC